jgi:hypothetical protein
VFIFFLLLQREIPFYIYIVTFWEKFQLKSDSQASVEHMDGVIAMLVGIAKIQ